MNRRTVFVLLLTALAVAATPVSGSSAPASRASTQTIPDLRVGLATPVSTLDAAHSQQAPYIASLGLEQLVQIGPTGQTMPWLALKVSHPSRNVYIYTLRKGVKFWDGTGLTATDVANALNYNRDPGAQTAYLFNSVKSIVALDRYRVAFTLKRPDASFVWAPAQYPGQIFEKTFSDAHKGTLGTPGVLTMGSGPWKIVSLDPTRGAELVANDKYWGGKPQIRRISFEFFADETSLALAFRAGDIDVAPQITNPQAFAATANTKLLNAPSCRQGFFGMNTQAAPWNDVHVRRAVAYALNRSDLVAATGGYATPTYTFIPRPQLLAIASKSQVNGLVKSLQKYQFDLTKAKQEMARSKYPKGFTVPFPTAPSGNRVQLVQVIAAELKQIGINLDVHVLTSAAWAAQVSGPAKSRPAFFSVSGCNSPDPGFYPGTYLGKKNLAAGSFNVADYAPNDVENLITAGVATSNPQKRFATYSTLLKRLAQDVPYVPLFLQNVSAAIADNLTWSTFNATWYNRVWALEIKAK
ncbi:MAG: ABC transporter substrate-binding protein [Vicinamibacterales bacterium]